MTTMLTLALQQTYPGWDDLIAVVVAAIITGAVLWARRRDRAREARSSEADDG